MKLPNVSSYRDRHGKRRYRFRKRGLPPVMLPGEPGSPEFMRALEAARAGVEIAAGATRVKAGSISAIVAAYYASADFKALRAITKSTYRNVLEKFRAGYADWPAAQMRASHLRAILDGMAATPEQANKLLKVLRVVFRVAVERELLGENPALAVKKLKAPRRGFAAWSDEEMARFEAHWPLGTRARLAYALLLYTSQRRQDVIALGRQHERTITVMIAGKSVTVRALVYRQSKTGREMTSAITAPLRAAIDAGPCGDLTYIVTGAGKPFGAAGFGNWFAATARAAGLPAGRSAHGLRKSAARRMAEAEVTTHGIGAVTGHTTLAEIQRYTDSARQAALNIQAAAAIHRNK